MSMLSIWTIILVVSIIIEAITIDLVSIWFGVGALIALICELLNVPSSIQIIIFIVISLMCIILARPLSKKYLRTNTIKTNLDRIIGKHCLVTESIFANHKGEVEVMSQKWMATSLNNETIEAGEQAQIVSIEGVHVVVKKIK